MRLVLWLACAVALASCSDSPTQPRDAQPSPTTLPGAWRATAAGGRPMPAVLQVFDPHLEEGELKSIHFVADSAALVLVAGGRYEHRVWFSEWEGPAGGAPTKVRYRWFHGDHGTWALDGTAVKLESGWIQNHRMSGSFAAGEGRLVVRHGLGIDDALADFVYRR